ncbi:MAG: preprotein translocase subunit SecG [Halofilum sp. (in: g-proteobacteria)]|nr:preprotein translocase subunit SecG [Halofilum sp. (in: g-proteobacteria)]
MQTVVLIIHVLLALAVIGLVLLQHGKGADAGAAFGSGASATVFGARGSGSFLTRMTTLCAALFFATSLGLAVMAAHRSGDSGSVVEREAQPEPAAESAGDLPPAGDEGGQASDVPQVD